MSTTLVLDNVNMTRGICTCRMAAKLLLLVAAVRAAPRITTNDGDFTVTVDGGKDVVSTMTCFPNCSSPRAGHGKWHTV